MPPPIVFDLLRLFLAASAGTPRGIDRVDLAYARFLFSDWAAECVGLLPTPWGLRLYDRKRVLDGLDAVEALWREHVTDVEQTTASPARARQAGRFLLRTGITAGSSVIHAAPRDSLYLNVGQLGWAAGCMASWLRHRPDVRAIFMLHDAIPIERPDLISRMGVAAHHRMMTVAARHAAGLIFATQAARAAVLRSLPRGQSAPATTCVHLPVAPAFLVPVEPDPLPRRRPYFVMVGAIEPRKNHLMLLNVWRGLARLAGHRMPQLLIAGTQTRGGREVLDQLQARGLLREHITVVANLPTPLLRHLVANAQALLMPSLAEGFGLPIVEALALGTPVVASDLPAHREIGGSLATYLSPTNEAAWGREVTRLTDHDDATMALRRRIAGYRPMTSTAYFDQIAGFLRSFATRSAH